MKTILDSIKTLLTVLLVLLFSTASHSQISVVSTRGYAVNISVIPIAIVPTSNSCTWGYNYNVKLSYNITITGANAPTSLYTLQGTLGCTAASHFFDLPNNGGSGTVVSQSNQWTSATDCGTATVVSKNCTSVNIQIEGPGISSRTVSFAPVFTTLAVKLLNFSAEAEKSRVKLNWATATETDNNFFTIERSADGTNWEAIKNVKGAGNSTSLISYESYDESPVSGTSYYRLKQTDFDGQVSYSAIQSVKFVSTAKELSLWPVPNTGNNITISGLTDYTNLELSVVNTGGNVIYNTTLSRASVELPSIRPGLYIIRVKNKVSGEAENMRYVKM